MRVEVALCAVASLFLPLTSARGEVASGDSASGVTLTSDYMVRYRAIFPPGRGREFGTFVTGDVSGEHRVFFDTKSGFYYGYDIKIAKSGTGGGFLLTLGPFSAERLLREMWPRLCRGCPDPRPVSSAQQRFPAPQVVAPGDKIVVDLLTDERNREVVSEEITVVSRDAPAPESAPQDFRAEDVAFRMNDVQLRVEGATVPKRAVGSVRGPVVWLQLPGHGRAFFSLVPRAGYAFKKIAVVAGNKLQVSLDGARYEWTSEGPIVTPGDGAQAWNVWVLHDPAFKSATADSLDMGGGLDDRLKSK